MSETPRVEQTKGSRSLLVFEVRDPSSWEEVDMLVHAVRHFIELSVDEKNEAGEVISSERGLWFSSDLRETLPSIRHPSKDLIYSISFSSHHNPMEQRCLSL